MNQTFWSMVWPGILIGSIGGFILSVSVVFLVYGAATIRAASYHPLYIQTARLALNMNMPRRPDENLSDWEKRVEVAHRELSDATTEFIRAAIGEGRRYSPPGSKDYELHLPADHPAALRYARAKGHLPRKVDKNLN